MTNTKHRPSITDYEISGSSGKAGTASVFRLLKSRSEGSLRKSRGSSLAAKRTVASAEVVDPPHDPEEESLDNSTVDIAYSVPSNVLVRQSSSESGDSQDDDTDLEDSTLGSGTELDEIDESRAKKKASERRYDASQDVSFQDMFKAGTKAAIDMVLSARDMLEIESIASEKNTGTRMHRPESFEYLEDDREDDPPKQRRKPATQFEDTSDSYHDEIFNFSNALFAATDGEKNAPAMIVLKNKSQGRKASTKYSKNRQKANLRRGSTNGSGRKNNWNYGDDLSTGGLSDGPNDPFSALGLSPFIPQW